MATWRKGRLGELEDSYPTYGMSQSKYTKEILAPIVREAISIAQVLRALGLKEAGGSYSHISRRIKEFELDTSHFLGQAANCGPNKKGGNTKTPWEDILVLREGGRREPAVRLRRALIESGRKFVCEECNQEPLWNGKQLMLQVDHINRNWLDNRPDNIRFLCPNCHSQTIGFNGSKGYTEVTKDCRHKKSKRKRTRLRSK